LTVIDVRRRAGRAALAAAAFTPSPASGRQDGAGEEAGLTGSCRAKLARAASRTAPARGRRRRTVAALVAALALAGASTAVAADTRPYPRTYHANSGWTDPNILGRYDMVVGYANWDLAKVKAVNPGGLFFLQPGLNPTGGSNYQTVHITTGAIDRFTGKTDTLPGGVNLGTIRPFDATWDYLYNANGSRAGSYPTWNFGGPSSKGTPTFIAKVIAYAAKLGGLYSKGWHGIHTDQWNYSFVWTYGTSLDADRNRQVDDITAARKAWQNGMSAAGKLLGTYLTGKSVGGNGAWWRTDLWWGNDPEGWRNSSNYTLIEHFEKHFYNNPDAAIAKANQWLGFTDPLGRNRYLATMHNAQRCDGALFQLPAGTNPNQNAYMLDPCVMRSMRWGLTLALMTGLYYEILVYRMHGTRWWYDEFDGGEGVRRRGYLGQPLGGPVKLPSGVYRRNFQNGIALNNSTASARTVSLNGTFKKLRGTQNRTLNNGASVTSVTIPAHDGIILLRP
jgi:hypothetical protein